MQSVHLVFAHSTPDQSEPEYASSEPVRPGGCQFSVVLAGEVVSHLLHGAGRLARLDRVVVDADHQG